MSTHEQQELVPEWSRGDRLRKARSLTGMTVAEFAQHIGVSDGTINNAEGDRRSVRRITMKAWAMATGVSEEWLETGRAMATPPPDPGARSAALDKLTARKASRGRTTRARSTNQYQPALVAA
jgi:transcriptional regulator with XRE-family HTH domain